MAELADALDLGSSEVTRAGSIPVTRTTFIKMSSTFLLVMAEGMEDFL